MKYYILFLLLLLIKTLINILTMPRISLSQNLKSYPKVSVLVPLRNEKRNAKRLVENLKKLSYENIEIILLDDHSTDGTYEILLENIVDDLRFNLLVGKELQVNWTGKVFACHQLSQQATGEYLLFLDADVAVDKDIIQKTLSFMERNHSSMVTGFPNFPVRTILATLLVPMQHFLVYTLLPNLIANRTTLVPFTAAHGAFLFIHQPAYEAIGGHKSIYNSLLDDVHLTVQLKRRKYKVTLANVSSMVRCDMYETNLEVWNGFLKNTFIGMGKNVWGVFFITLYFLSCYVVPLGLLVIGFIQLKLLFAIPFIIVWIEALFIDLTAKQSPFRSLLQPIAVIALVIILHASMIRSMRSKGYNWKGRVYH